MQSSGLLTLLRAMSGWTVSESRELYGTHRWGNDFFDIDGNGDASVALRDGDSTVRVSLKKIVDGVRERGFALPQILRFRDLLDRRIEELNEAFNSAIATTGYQGRYRGVYPIKVNQQQQVIEEVATFGAAYHYGFEAGSKPELIAALAYMRDPEALIICNGYKDDEFIDLALLASQVGRQIVIVLEMPGELADVLRRARELDIRPTLGIRFRLSTKSEGHWADSGGDRSVFGLNTTQVLDAVDLLRDEGYLDCLRLFHYHQGSQLPNIRAIREAATEAVHVYTSLVKEGAPMGMLDMGGGLAVDYDGSHQNHASSCNYSISEYAVDLVEVVQQLCRSAEVPEPDIITEAGRAIVAYYSVLAFDILDVSRFEETEAPEPPGESAPDVIKSLYEIHSRICEKDLQECFNDALYYRDKARAEFIHGSLPLRARGEAERLYWWVCTTMAAIVRTMDDPPEELLVLDDNLIDFYYANFSVFQSLPDAWAIDQLFPIMPLHRLDEEPTHRAILADITCDCDGKISKFIDGEGTRNHLPVHDRKEGDDYVIGAFLVGAYQETLGDLHNLLGDPHVVSVGVKNGEITYDHEVEGDTVADVLSYVEYDTKDLVRRFREDVEAAVSKGKITVQQRKHILSAFREGLNGYTYYEA